MPFRVTNGPLARLREAMATEGGGDGRRLLDAAVARTLAERTAWVRQFVRAGRDAASPDDLRVEGAVDLRRRIGVVAEAIVPHAAVSRFETARIGPLRHLVVALGERRAVVYAGGSRYVENDDGWMHVAGGIEAPRLPSDPVWLLDALAYARDCVVDGDEVTCRLDLSRADELDRSGIVPASRWRGIVRTSQRRRREGWLGHVPCVVAIDSDGTIARMSYAGLPPSEEVGLLWATTEFVDYRVPVEIPDLTARAPAAV
jgi:hypothetical protein